MLGSNLLVSTTLLIRHAMNHLGTAADPLELWLSATPPRALWGTVHPREAAQNIHSAQLCPFLAPGALQLSSCSEGISLKHPLLTCTDILQHLIHAYSFTAQMLLPGVLQHRLNTISSTLHWKQPTNLTYTSTKSMPRRC